MIINENSCVNIIAKSVVERMNLEREPHPQPYNVTWANKNCSICHPVLSSDNPIFELLGPHLV